MINIKNLKAFKAWQKSDGINQDMDLLMYLQIMVVGFVLFEVSGLVVFLYIVPVVIGYYVIKTLRYNTLMGGILLSQGEKAVREADAKAKFISKPETLFFLPSVIVGVIITLLSRQLSKEEIDGK